MSSDTSVNDILYRIQEVVDTDEVNTVNTERQRLKMKNKMKLMDVIQENIKLRLSLRDLKKEIQEDLSPPRRSKKDTKDPEKLKMCQRIVGEIAFQLDRRILCAVFLDHQRFYGYRVSELKKKIIQAYTCPLTGKIHERLRSELNERFYETMRQLKGLGYDFNTHPQFTEHLVNTYGILEERTLEYMSSMSNPQYLTHLICQYMVGEKVADILTILRCLAFFSQQDGSPMFKY